MNHQVWHKSSYSPSGSDCVEVRETPCGADVRDTKNRDAAVLSFPVGEWTALLLGATETR